MGKPGSRFYRALPTKSGANPADPCAGSASIDAIKLPLSEATARASQGLLGLECPWALLTLTDLPFWSQRVSPSFYLWGGGSVHSPGDSGVFLSIYSFTSLGLLTHLLLPAFISYLCRSPRAPSCPSHPVSPPLSFLPFFPQHFFSLPHSSLLFVLPNAPPSPPPVPLPPLLPSPTFHLIPAPLSATRDSFPYLHSLGHSVPVHWWLGVCEGVGGVLQGRGLCSCSSHSHSAGDCP